MNAFVHVRRTACLAVLCIMMAGVYPPRLRAQDTAESPARNSVFFELWGNNLFYSVNYDRKVTDHISLRGGFGGWGSDLAIDAAMMMPILVNSLVGKGEHRIELGVGVTTGVWWESDYGGPGPTHTPTAILVPTATLGYRYQPLASGWLFRVNFTPTPFFNSSTDADDGHIWFGISLGRTW